MDTPIKLTIKSMYKNLSPKEKAIADYLLEDSDELYMSSLSDIATKLNVSNSAIFQFTKKIGYDGFKDFKNALIFQKKDFDANKNKDLYKSEDVNLDIVYKVFDTSIDSLEDTKKLIDINSIKDATNIMMSSAVVKFFGMGGSGAVAYDAYHKFLKSPINVKFAADYHIQLMEASIMNKSECAFVISNNGNNKNILNIVAEAKEKGAKVISVTSQSKSELAKVSDVVLLSSVGDVFLRPEALASRISQLTIIDSLFSLLTFHLNKKSNTALANIRKSIKRTRI